MHLIKVDATNSTNSFLKELYKTDPQLEATCVLAETQLNGRGQRGASWTSNKGENLTFSIFFPHLSLLPEEQFFLSALVATQLVNLLHKWDIPKLKLKWPNDIMAGNLKIGGILIENVISGNKISASIIGIGLNVNQTEFPGLPKAGSMKKVTGKSFNKEVLLQEILIELEKSLLAFKKKKDPLILKQYEKHLFRFQMVSTFQLPDHSLFSGMITGINREGKLLVKAEEEKIKTFDLKEVKLLW